MKVLYMSPNGQVNKRLFPIFNEGEVANPIDADYCFIEVVSGLCQYDENLLLLIRKSNIPVVYFDNREYGPMQKEPWSPRYELNPIAYFIRNMDKWGKYPKNCYPLDWPYFEECEWRPTTKDELFNRGYDVMFSGTESPTRKNLEGIIKDHRIVTHFEFREHTQRVSLERWVWEHTMSKTFISCDGGGFTDERIQQLFSVAAILKNKNNHRPNNPFTDKINCIEVSEHPTKEELDDLIKIVNDKEWLYEIYLNGIAHVKKYYSKEYRANYILNILNEKEGSKTI